MIKYSKDSIPRIRMEACVLRTPGRLRGIVFFGVICMNHLQFVE